jgi:haloalkane dehalogenase
VEPSSPGRHVRRGGPPASILHQLSAEQTDAYREPFRERKEPPTHTGVAAGNPHRRPGPPDVVETVEANDEWLASSTDVPKLLLTFEPSAIMSEPVVSWCRENLAALEVVATGKGIPFVQEDEPEVILRTVRDGRRRMPGRWPAGRARSPAESIQ